MFKSRRFPVEISLLSVRWYCKYGVSYRDLAEMVQDGDWWLELLRENQWRA